MSFGVFEAALGSEVEVGLAKQASVDKMAAAIYDVREKLGPILFASRDREEFRHKVAMMKADQSVYKIISAHLMPLPKVIRDIVGKNSVLEREFVQRLADNTAMPGINPPPTPGANSIDPTLNSAPGSGVTTPPADGIDRGLMQSQFGGTTAMRKGAPFAGYEDFDDCTSKNSDKGRPDAYCGEIKHRTEDKKEGRRLRADGTVDVKPAFEDHRGQELEPEGDFKGYLDDRDQGAEEKIRDNFVGEPVGTHTEDPAKHNFASRKRIAHYVRWCQANGLSPIRMSSLDHYAVNLSDLTYAKLAHTITAWENEHHPKTPSTKLKSKDKVAAYDEDYHTLRKMRESDPGKKYYDPDQFPGLFSDETKKKVDRDLGRQGSRDPMRPYKAWCRKHGLRMISARNINHYAARDPQLAYFLAMRCKEAIKVARRRQANEEAVGGPNTHVVDIIDQLGDPADVMGPRHGRRRQAAPDYLQKADDALTQLLNQKAEEFQQTIAPLQQALITVQQAEQLQQQQNPLNVLPPPGTVNVMPGQADSTPGQLGMPDPNQPDMSALVQALQPGGGAMGGVAPQDSPDGGQGAPPPAAAGGGLPPDMDPSQRAARRGKARGAVRPRQAAGVGELWDHWKNQRSEQGDALRGDEVDYSRFQQEHGVGDRALTNLKKRNETPDFAPINGQGRGRSPQGAGTTVGRKQACWPGCHENEAHAKKFHSKESRRRQSAPQYDTFHDPAQGSPQAEYSHPGQPRGWKGQFAQEPQGPYDGEFYTKGRANVRGGPGPDTSKYWLTTPHGIHGPHTNVHDAFDAAEPFLAQDAEIGKGQGTLLDAPSQGDVRPRTPLAQRKRAKGKHWYADPEHPIKNPVNPYTGHDMFEEEEDLTPKAARKSYRKQAWTGWGPSVYPKTRKVAGWDWNDYQNGYLANSPRHFECSCGDQFPTPSGFHRCACGKQWNSYVIGSGGSNREASAEQFIVREVPVRPDVIVANRKLAQVQRANRPVANKAVQLVDKHGNIHNLVDPGELGDGDDPGHPTFKKQPKDWARRGDGAKWTKNPIG